MSKHEMLKHVSELEELYHNKKHFIYETIIPCNLDKSQADIIQVAGASVSKN